MDEIQQLKKTASSLRNELENLRFEKDVAVQKAAQSSAAGNVIDRPAPNVFGSLLTVGLSCLRVIEILNVSNLCQIRSIS